MIFFFCYFTLGVDQALEQHVIIYNPLAWNITTVVNITVTLAGAAVYDDEGQPVSAQVGPDPDKSFV